MCLGISGAAAGKLHDAVLANDLDELEALLEDGVEVDESDFLLGTALHHAAIVGNAAAAEVLIGQGADVEAPSEQEGSHPLHLAAQTGSNETLALLLKVGAYIEAEDSLGQRPLGRAAVGGQTEAVAILLESEAEIDARQGIYKRTALIEAAYVGCFGCVKLLVQRGAAIDAQDDRGKTALWYAATPESYSPAGGSQLLEFLAKSGADLELADNTGTTPLAWARKSPGRAETYREIAEDLVRLGATK